MRASTVLSRPLWMAQFLTFFVSQWLMKPIPTLVSRSTSGLVLVQTDSRVAWYPLSTDISKYRLSVFQSSYSHNPLFGNQDDAYITLFTADGQFYKQQKEIYLVERPCERIKIERMKRMLFILSSSAYFFFSMYCSRNSIVVPIRGQKRNLSQLFYVAFTVTYLQNESWSLIDFYCTSNVVLAEE